MKYRMATGLDIPQLVELRMLEQENDWKDQYPITQEFKDITKDFFEKNLVKNLYVFVAEENKKIIATAAIMPHQYLPQADEFTGKRGYLCNVYTLPEYRRRGIQKELFVQLKDFSKRVLKIARIDLHATLSPEVFSMYEKIGFKFVENNARLILNSNDNISN